MSIPVHRRQTALLRFIAGYQRHHDGVSPTLQECADALGLGGKAQVQQLLIRLEDRGLIRRIRSRARAIELLAAVAVPTLPDGAPLHEVPWRFKPRRVGSRLMDWPTFAGASDGPLLFTAQVP